MPRFVTLPKDSDPAFDSGVTKDACGAPAPTIRKRGTLINEPIRIRLPGGPHNDPQRWPPHVMIAFETQCDSGTIDAPATTAF